MPSPMMTVVILAVLWLIVVVPMVLRRSDERKRERSVADWGRSMRALGRQARTGAGAPADVFVPRPSETRALTTASRAPAAPLAAPARRPVPAAQEALMYPPDRTELSDARTAMLRRRRRSLLTLVGGSIVFTIVALLVGGLTWLLSAAFLAGFVGYLWFLRSQALNDRTRRESRQHRAAARRPVGYDATSDVARLAEVPESVVRIDDDDLELHNLDTIDLTGLYNEEAAAEAMQRRAS